MRNRFWAAAAGLAAWMPSIGLASEPNGPLGAQPCSGTVTRSTLTACALANTPILREALAAQQAAEGRREAVGPFFPSNMVLSGALASRSRPTEQQLNWNLALGQELEVAGQRGLRIDVADAELRTQAQRLATVKATVAEAAWSAYFKVIAARERFALAIKLETATEVVASTVRGMAGGGLASDVDADVAQAAAIRAAKDRLNAEASVAVALAQLGLHSKGAGALAVSGELEPLKSVTDAAMSVVERPELLAVREVQLAFHRRVDLLRRSRVPNPTVSLFAQNDGFDERVWGVGLSIPVPLPQPLGRTLGGEVTEAVALAERADAEAERVQRELAAELAIAVAEYQAALKTRDLYPTDRVQKTTARLQNIALQVKAGRLPVRDALVAQQALVEQLLTEIDARETLCATSVRLTRAAGHSLEGDSL